MNRAVWINVRTPRGVLGMPADDNPERTIRFLAALAPEGEWFCTPDEHQPETPR